MAFTINPHVRSAPIVSAVPELRKPSLSLGTKLFSGLNLQSTGMRSGFYSNGRPNLSSDLHYSVHRSLRVGNAKHRSARITMMALGTPSVPVRSPGGGPWQWVDLWNALYRERIIYIGQEIDEEFSNMILATMLYLDSVESSKKLYLFISSPGGDITPSMAIYDTMRSLKSPIATRCIGHAYGLSAYILAAGKKGDRLGMPMCRVLLESPSGNAYGMADDVLNEASELVRVRDYLCKELSGHTGQPLERIVADVEKGKGFDVEQAIEYGLLDHIIRPQRLSQDATPREGRTTGLG